mmetsp:Transcript_18533/g.26886  ORF Transcript_18533/g.26886 Transcript_18533/m.26886 type:complete len:586 (-) Transcript_18533:91-1848(-)
MALSMELISKSLIFLLGFQVFQTLGFCGTGFQSTICPSVTPLNVGKSFARIDPNRNIFSAGSESEKELYRGHSTLYASSAGFAGAFDKEAFDLPSQKVIDAVEKAGYRATASDIAAVGGLNLEETRRDLLRLASLVEGELEVSNSGELVYNFSSNFRQKLSASSAVQRAKELWMSVQPLLSYLVRVSFGIVLLVSIVLIFSSIFFISQTTRSSDDEDRRSNRPMGGGMSFYFGPSPLDFFFYRPYYTSYSDGVPLQDPEEMGFLESVFSYVFGDGDPNADIDDERMRLLADVIRSNNGAVTAEQLAPYLDGAPEPPSSGSMNGNSYLVDEKFVLPVVTLFNGRPEVTEDGDIVYLFPDLQTTALGDPALRGDLSKKDSSELKMMLAERGVDPRGMLEKGELVSALSSWNQMNAEVRSTSRSLSQAAPALLEREIPFSLATKLKLFFAGGLGAVNLAGALYLGAQLSSPIVKAKLAYAGALPIAITAYPLLLSYAILFNVIPLVRKFQVDNKNNSIDERNDLRLKWARFVANAPGGLAKKIKAASRLGTRMQVVGADDITYTSGKDIAEQDTSDPTMDDFDKRLRG